MNELGGALGPTAVRELTAGVRCSVPVLHLLLLPLQLSCFPLQLLLLSHQVGLPSSRRRLDGNKSILLSQFWLSYLFVYFFSVCVGRKKHSFSTCVTHLWVLLHRGGQDGGLGRGSRDGDGPSRVPSLSHKSKAIFTKQQFTGQYRNKKQQTISVAVNGLKSSMFPALLLVAFAMESS